MVSVHSLLFRGALYRQHGPTFYSWGFRGCFPNSFFYSSRKRAFISHNKCFLGAFKFGYWLFAHACGKGFKSKANLNHCLFSWYRAHELDAECCIHGKANAVLETGLKFVYLTAF